MRKSAHALARSLESPFLSLLRWFDTEAGTEVEQQGEKQRTDWVRMIPFVGLHLGCLGVFWVGWSWIAVGMAATLYFVRMFAVTAFYHRYFSHRTFKTSRGIQFLFAVLGNLAVQRGPLWWAAHHRHHHRHSDEEADVHSPHQHGFYWSHCGWITCRSNFPTKRQFVKDLSKFPELRFLDRFDSLIPLLLAVFLFGLGHGLGIFWPELGTSGPQMLVWAFFVSTVVLFHCTCLINSLAHVFGKRRFDTSDESRNSFLLALITLGEGWHNNHHRYPSTARQGFYWWEIDITFYLLLGLARLGIIWELRGVPARVWRPGKP
jgi:stearoyl-CoA desaturase (delta-9 desaturase)